MHELPVCMAHHYQEFVRLGLKAAGLYVSQEWFLTQAKRIELHRQMGFTPPQSVEELRPFAEGARRPLASGVAGLRSLRKFCNDKVRALREEAGGHLPGDPHQPKETTMTEPKTAPVGGVWLLTTGDRLKVLVEVAGQWRVAIDEGRPLNADGTRMIVSHCAHATGFGNLPLEDSL